jgi:hypothetical protein
MLELVDRYSTIVPLAERHPPLIIVYDDEPVRW